MYAECIFGLKKISAKKLCALHSELQQEYKRKKNHEKHKNKTPCVSVECEISEKGKIASSATKKNKMGWWLCELVSVVVRVLSHAVYFFVIKLSFVRVKWDWSIHFSTKLIRNERGWDMKNCCAMTSVFMRADIQIHNKVSPYIQRLQYNEWQKQLTTVYTKQQCKQLQTIHVWSILNGMKTWNKQMMVKKDRIVL